ncbi:MAG: hypothetical protein ACLFVU_04330 [Phycisphaerae bacterium]
MDRIDSEHWSVFCRPGEEWICAEYRGDISFDDLVSATRAIVKMVRRKGYYRGMADMTAVTDLVPLTELRKYVSETVGMVSPDVQVKWAMVAPEDFIYGTARQYKAMMEHALASVEYQVFRDKDAAKRWLTDEADTNP